MKVGLTGLIVIMLVLNLHAQTNADSSAIKKAAMDYVEGWYQGSTARTFSIISRLSRRFQLDM